MTESSRPLATAPLTQGFLDATPAEIEILAFLMKRKAEALAWVAEDPENRWSSRASAEYTVEYIREMGWADLDAMLLEEIRCEYCDLHKTVRGVKARWAFGMSYDECKRQIYSLLRETETPEYQARKAEERAEIARWEAEYKAEMEWYAQVEREMQKGAPDLSPEPDAHEVYAPIFKFS